MDESVHMVGIIVGKVLNSKHWELLHYEGSKFMMQTPLNVFVALWLKDVWLYGKWVGQFKFSNTFELMGSNLEIYELLCVKR